MGDMSSEAGILYDSVNADCFQLNDQCEEAFQSLKWKLIYSPLRAHPDLSKRFILSTDASGYGVRGVLVQQENWLDRHIGYFNKVV